MTDEGGELRIELLGPVRAWRGGAELELGPARQRAVFAVLALRAGRTVTARDLVAAVWGEDAPASAAGNVHTYVSGLRRVLEPGRERGSASSLLITGPAGYLLRLDPGCVDATVFERLLADARQGRTSPSAALLDKALGLWLGEPLSGLPGPYADRERARFTELRITALELRAEALLTSGDHQELAAELTTFTREYPLRERFWELLMLAFHRSGQQAEALAAYRTARATLIAELGVEPGPALQRVQAQVLSEEARRTADTPGNEMNRVAARDRLFVLPAQVAGRFEAGVRSAFVGRAPELSRLRALVGDVRAGRGGCAWVEGEYGIGKSELLVNALWDVGARDCQVGWATADELSACIPFQAMFSCLGAGEALGDQHRAGQPAGVRQHPVAGEILARVSELCAEAPLVLVIDDAQWADEASLLVWHRLAAATRQLPLLLVVAARPVPRQGELVRLKQVIEASDGEIFPLSPLSSAESLELHELLIGARAGPDLRDLVERTTGNPLYITELTDGLVRENALITTIGVAELGDPASYTPPRSLVDAIRRNLDLLSGDTQEALRWAALLGSEFTVTDLATVTGKQPTELLPVVQEAVAAHAVVDAGSHLAFRQPLLRQACYQDIPLGARASLHRQAAESLAAAGAPVSRIAEQVAALRSVDTWVLQWLTENHDAVSDRAPLIAVDLLTRALEGCSPHDPRREIISAALAGLRTRLGLPLPSEAPFEAAPARAERREQLLTDFRRVDLEDLDAVEAAGHRELTMAQGDSHRSACALQKLWLVASSRRDHDTALIHVDKAIAAEESAELKATLLDNRAFTLQNLDRLAEAGTSLRTARRLAAGRPQAGRLQASAVVHSYWTGNWPDALAELDSVAGEYAGTGPGEPPGTALLLHGIGALIAGQQTDTIRAAAHLEAVEEYVPVARGDAALFDFLLAARSLAIMQQGNLERALRVLDPILDPWRPPMMPRHQWLPAIVRIALGTENRDHALRAMRIGMEDAARERVSAQAAVAAGWCRGLVEADPEPVLAAADHCRGAGRLVELGQALEDAAAILAARGENAAARSAFDEGTRAYEALGARWNLHRADERLSGYGISRDGRPAQPRSPAGGPTLTPVENEIARLIVAGYPSTAIANRLGLPHRAVEVHVVRLLGKLDVPARDRLARDSS